MAFLEPVETGDTLPATCEVLVVGGGIVGVTTALFLARQGVPVLLCEKGVMGGEQSSRNWGWIGKQKRDPRELALCLDSLEVWSELRDIAGPGLGYRQTGMLHLCESDADAARQEAWLRLVAPAGLDSRMIGRAELSQLLGEDRHPWKAALHSPTDARANPRWAVPLLARAAIKAGARLLQDCAVRGFETTAGRLSGAITERGRVACHAALLAGGAWSRLILAQRGIAFPQLTVLSSNQRILARPRAPAGPPLASLWGRGFSLGQFEDGTLGVAAGEPALHDIIPASFRYLPAFIPFLLSWHHLGLRLGRPFLDELRWARPWALDRPTPLEAVRTLDPRPSRRHLDGALAALARALPAYERPAVAARWAGYIEMVPDGLPVISEVDALPGLFLSSSSGHGFGIGPSAGKMLAAMMTGATPAVDPRPFQFSRFSEKPAPRPLVDM